MQTNKQRVYLSPSNDISKELSKKKSFLDKYELLGFIDKYKHEINTDTIETISNDYDLIIISSTNHFSQIYKEYINFNINKNKIIFYVHEFQIFSKYFLYLKYFYKLYNFKKKYTNVKNYIKITSLKNKHKDKRIFLIGNGPSLKVEDLNQLKNELTFAANKIYLSYPQTEWRPTYYMVEDDLVFKQNYETIKKLQGSIKLFPNFTKIWRPTINDSFYFELKYFPQKEDFPQFGINPHNGIYWGSTVIFTMIQWAVYFGCKEIYLIGVDFNFTEPKTYIINEENRKDLICEGEVNHFHKDYRKIGEKWNLPNLDVQLKTFKKAKEYCDQNAIKIFNISRKTKLNIFEKKELKNII